MFLQHLIFFQMSDDFTLVSPFSIVYPYDAVFCNVVITTRDGRLETDTMHQLNMLSLVTTALDIKCVYLVCNLLNHRMKYIFQQTYNSILTQLIKINAASNMFSSHFGFIETWVSVMLKHWESFNVTFFIKSRTADVGRSFPRIPSTSAGCGPEMSSWFLK